MTQKIYINDGKKQVVVFTKTFLGRVYWANAAVKAPGKLMMSSIPVEKIESSTPSEEFAYWIRRLKRKILKQLRQYLGQSGRRSV